MVYQTTWGEGLTLGCGSKNVGSKTGCSRCFTGGVDYHFNSERLDTLMAGGAIQQSTVILQNAEEELGLRPELTARSLARL